MIRKETVMRLLKDIKEIYKNPLVSNGIHYIHDETDMLKGYAMIIGPSDTPYFGGFYFFEINYPQDYPYSTPKVKFCTNGECIRFNPNLYQDGKVCISILNTWKGEQWSACQTISSILLSLLTLFINNPLLNEPGVKHNLTDIIMYNKIIEFANLKIAICDILNKKLGIYLPFFDLFETEMRENFKNNVNTYILFAKNKSQIEVLNLTRYYKSMGYVTINYKLVTDKLIELKHKLINN
jgi:ubiquitin-conjugating enzyme E2 Z